MKIEDALLILEGCLIEPIVNDKHKSVDMRRVIEIQHDKDLMDRIIGYGSTFESAIINAATNYSAKYLAP